MKKIAALVLVLTILGCMAACGGGATSSSMSATTDRTVSSESIAQPQMKQVAVISTGQRLSSSFGQGVVTEATRFAEENGLGMECYPADSKDDADAALAQAIENGAEVVVGMDAGVSNKLASLAESNPSVSFIVLDREASFALPDSPQGNLLTIGFCPAGAGWQAGFAAGCTALGSENGDTAEGLLQPQVAILLPVYSITAVAPPDPNAVPAPPTDCFDDTMGAILEMVIPSRSEWGDRISITQGNLLYGLSTLYGIDAAAEALGVAEMGTPVLFVPVLCSGAELDEGGELDEQTAQQNAFETAIGLYESGIAVVIGVGEWQAPVQRAAQATNAWCVEQGENPGFAADGFGEAAAAGVLQSGGLPVYAALEEWFTGKFEGGPRQVGAPQGGWQLVINEKVLISGASVAPVLTSTSLELMQNAMQAYIDSGDEEDLGVLKQRAMNGFVLEPDEYGFTRVVVQAP